MRKNIGKNVSKNWSNKYGQKPLDRAKRSATDTIKSHSKNTETTGDLIRHKIANKITKLSRNSPQNNLWTVTNEQDNEIPKERYISPEERQDNIDETRLK